MGIRCVSGQNIPCHFSCTEDAFVSKLGQVDAKGHLICGVLVQACMTQRMHGSGGTACAACAARTPNSACLLDLPLTLPPAEYIERWRVRWWRLIIARLSHGDFADMQGLGRGYPLTHA